MEITSNTEPPIARASNPGLIRSRHPDAQLAFPNHCLGGLRRGGGKGIGVRQVRRGGDEVDESSGVNCRGDA